MQADSKGSHKASRNIAGTDQDKQITHREHRESDSRVSSSQQSFNSPPGAGNRTCTHAHRHPQACTHLCGTATPSKPFMTVVHPLQHFYLESALVGL